MKGQEAKIEFLRLQDRHGSLSEVKRKPFTGRSDYGLVERHIFEDGSSERFDINKKSERRFKIKWQDKEFILDKSDLISSDQTSSGEIPAPIPSGHEENNPQPSVRTNQKKDDRRSGNKGNISQSSVTTQSEDWEITHLPIGTDNTVYEARQGRSETVNEWLGTANAKHIVDNGESECQLQTRATFLGIPGAYAQTWYTFLVEPSSGEPSDKHADITITPDWDVSWLGAGGSGSWKIGVYVWDYNDSKFVDKEITDKAQVAPADLRFDQENASITMGVNLEVGKQYGAGLYAGASSGAVALETSMIDMWPSGEFDGGARFTDSDCCKSVPGRPHESVRSHR
ncbi:MAG: hypothetical protein V5A34_04275 [Halapricum sp.]